MYSGVADWGQSYAFVAFPLEGNRTVLIGWVSHIAISDGERWIRAHVPVLRPCPSLLSPPLHQTYEDDETLALAKPMGYQGAFTLFRDLYLKKIYNVDASRVPDLYEKGSWGVKNESDGSITVSTVGQHIIPETMTAYKTHSNVVELNDRAVSDGYEAFESQPTGRHYVV